MVYVALRMYVTYRYCLHPSYLFLKCFKISFSLQPPRSIPPSPVLRCLCRFPCQPQPSIPVQHISLLLSLLFLSPLLTFPFNREFPPPRSLCLRVWARGWTRWGWPPHDLDLPAAVSHGCCEGCITVSWERPSVLLAHVPCFVCGSAAPFRVIVALCRHWSSNGACSRPEILATCCRLV